MSKKRILIVGESHIIKTFVYLTLKTIQADKDVQFDAFITYVKSPNDLNELDNLFTNIFVNRSREKSLGKIPKLGTLIAYINLYIMSLRLPKYDIVHFHYFHHYYYLIVKGLSLKSKKILISFFGSDFNNLSNYKHWLNKKSLKYVSAIYATQPVFLKKVLAKYNRPNLDSGILPQLVAVFEQLKNYIENTSNITAKKQLNFPYDKKIMVCGYCGDENMQFNHLILAIKNNAELLHDYHLVFPMTYGRNLNNNHLYIENELSSSGFSFQILKKYLTVEEVLALRRAGDIFLLTPKRDQLAGALYEHLAGGAYVITGKWLPYDDLDRLGIQYTRMESIDDLTKTLNDVLVNWPTYENLISGNKEIIYKLIDWEINKQNWITAYSL